MKFSLATNLLSLASLVLGASRTTAPSGALVVGSGQKYTTISKAVAALSSTSTSEQIIFIQPGTYKEQVYIPALKGPLTIYGSTKDTTTYSSNQVIITSGYGLDSKSTDDETATLRVWTQNFKLYNVNVKNTRGQGSQALALSAYAANQGYYACQFTGFQDTVLAQQGAQLYAKSYIEGATDFVFGQHAQAWFEQVHFGVLAASQGYVTASGRASNDDGYYVINKGTIAAAAGNTVPAGAYYLGRPWGAFARVVFQSTSMSNVINAKGWSVWQTSDTRTSNVVFEEYGNTGAGASGTRATFSKKISSPIAITTVLGSGYASAKYVDTSYM